MEEMDRSLSHFELTDNNTKNGSDSGSDKNEPNIDMFAYGDTDSSNGNKSDEDFDHNLPETVCLIANEENNTKVYIVGTAHFSKESQNDVEKVIRHVQPNMVVLELCNSRLNILNLDEETILREAQEIDTRKMITTLRTSGFYNGLIYLLLLDISAHITKQIGMAPGGEFRVAYKEAEKIPNCQVQLGDRPINITLKRALARLTWLQTIKLVWHLLHSKEPVSKEDIERCKNKDMLEQLLAEFADEYPEFKEVFVIERDVYLTHSLQTAVNSLVAKRAAQGDEKTKKETIKVVGVVGIGHMPGILSLFSTNQRPFIADILQVPPPSKVSKFIKLAFKASLYIGGGYLVYRWVPVPKILQENVRFAVHNVITTVSTSKIRFNYGGKL